MKAYAAHLKRHRPPLLMSDGWSWGAFVFGPLWLLSMRAWIPALLEIVALTLLFTFSPAWFWRPALLGLTLINGLLGRDMVGWALCRQGYAVAHVVLAPDRDAAMLRLFAAQPDLMDQQR